MSEFEYDQEVCEWIHYNVTAISSESYESNDREVICRPCRRGLTLLFAHFDEHVITPCCRALMKDLIILMLLQSISQLLKS